MKIRDFLYFPVLRSNFPKKTSFEAFIGLNITPICPFYKSVLDNPPPPTLRLPCDVAACLRSQLV